MSEILRRAWHSCTQDFNNTIPARLEVKFLTAYYFATWPL